MPKERRDSFFHGFIGECWGKMNLSSVLHVCLMQASPSRYYVTVALPYANGPLHLGHLVEMIEADLWVRAKKAQGHSVLFVSGNDAHGTPIMIHAQKLNKTPFDLVSSIHALHTEMIHKYAISLDYYGRTDTELNQKWCYKIYESLLKTNIFQEKSVEQYFDESANMFLPDRFVKGICPKCQSPDQNGDHCDACGATYDPTELIAPYSIISGEKPVMRTASHVFVELEPYRQWLKEYLPGKISSKIISKFNEWLDQPLRSWDITRDAPYYGIPIPHRPNQYFYVWFDAPIGYIALFDYISQMKDISFEHFYDDTSHLVHFIGKDISYFHGIFWPVILKAAGLPLPNNIHVHGFLTLNGQKMSKSRGIVCDPKTLSQHIPPDCVRYYLASKMSGSIDDINFDIAECVGKINSDLVGKTLNILSRCSKLLFDHFDGKCSSQFSQTFFGPEMTGHIYELYHQRHYHLVIQTIMKEMTALNEDLTAHAPWSSLKADPGNTPAWDILTLCLKKFFELIVLLEPIIPHFSADILSYQGVDRLLKPYSMILNRLNKDTIQGALTMPNSIPTEQTLSHSAEQSHPATPSLSTVEPIKEIIDIQTFSKIDLRIGRVLECSAVEKSEKLLVLKVDIGLKVIQIFSGIKAYIHPSDLIGKCVVVCVNLAPRKMSVGLSEGMLLSAHDDLTLTPLTVLSELSLGSVIS
jgi:methionyl-tRNA synthetase